MHVMEDVREGSDVPGAQPSSPGHAEQRPTVEDHSDEVIVKENGSETDEPSIGITNGTEETVIKEEIKQVEDEIVDVVGIKEADGESSLPLDDAASNDSAEDNSFSKRKLEMEETPSKRLRSELEQNYILRDKFFNDYVDTAGCSSVQQIQTNMDQLLSEVRTLNELAKEKEKEWNNIIHLKKIKEELLLRIQRRKQVLILSNDKVEWNETEEVPEDLERTKSKQVGGKNSVTSANSGGLMIFSTSGSSGFKDTLTTKQKNLLKQFPNTIIEINGQGGDLKQNRQRPVLDVQSIIADYRQRHPEAVPRRGRRIRSILNTQGDCSMGNKKRHGGVISFSSILLGSGAQVRQNLNASSIEANSELGLLLTAVDSVSIHFLLTFPTFFLFHFFKTKQAKQTGTKAPNDGQKQIDTASFKDVLVQFAKLSRHDQDLLQTAIKPASYTEVTVHPVPPHTQSSSNSLLHGILTKVILF